MSQSKESRSRQRKLPNLPTLESGVNGEVATYNAFRRRHTHSDLFAANGNTSARHPCGITKDIVEQIKAAETERSWQQVEMDSVMQDQAYGDAIALVGNTTRRIAGILDSYQDEQGYWLRKIEITKVPGQGLGFFIKKGNGFDRKNGVFISRVSLGSILDAYGLLHTGDEVLEVNRVNLRGFTLEDVALMMQIPDRLLLTTKSRVPVNNKQKSAQNYDKRQGKKSQKSKQREPLMKQLSTPIDNKLDFNSNIQEGERYTQSEVDPYEKAKAYSKKSQNDKSKTAGHKEKYKREKKLSSALVLPLKFSESPDSGIEAIGGIKNLPEMPSKVTKSPRKLPTPPPFYGRKFSIGADKGHVFEEVNSMEKSTGTAPTTLGFKRAEMYREKSIDQKEELGSTHSSLQIPLFTLNGADEQLRKIEPKGPRRAMSVTEHVKSPSKLGLFRGFSTSPRGDRKDVKTEPERLYEPYKTDDLNSEMQFTRAFSGMLSVYIDKLHRTKQKLPKSEFYCTIEIDDEFKASTARKKCNSGQTVCFDEQFDIEISHASELTVYIFEIGHENQHSLSASGVVFLEKVLSRATSRSIALELEGPGVINATLDFTEAVKFLKRTPSSRKKGVFGFNIVSTLDNEQNTIPKIVRKCVGEIEKRGMSIVGIYRVSGNAKKKRLLKAEFDQDSSAVDVSEESGVDCNVLTGIIKDYLRELPEPLIPESALQLISEAKTSEMSPNMNKRQNILCELLKKLPYGSRATLIYIMDHLIRVQEMKETNRMDITNLAVCFGPVLMCPASTKAVLDFKNIIDALEHLLKIWPKDHERGVEIEITNM